MSSSDSVFRNNKHKQNSVAFGLVILVSVTLISCVSSFMIYREGFADLPARMQSLLALAAVVAVEGAFIWLVYGFTRAFSSALERLIALTGMAFLVGAMLVNITTHFMIVRHVELNAFQHAWLSYGAVAVFIAVLLVSLLLTLSDPVVRLIRLELRYLGRQQETILEAKTEGLDSQVIQDALTARAAIEAERLAARILQAGPAPLAIEPAAASRIGFTRAEDQPGK